MIQACFDDSGNTEAPVFVLAGFVARLRQWQVYSREWERILNVAPKVPFLSTNEAFQQRGCFAGWSKGAVEDRLLKLVQVIQNRVDGGVIFTLDHDGYKAVMAKVDELTLTPERRKVRMLKNPFYVGFHVVVLTMLAKHQAIQTQERLEILFDEGIDRHNRLENGYRDLVRGIARQHPSHINLLVNKEAEFRDEKMFLPLQAADLLAWNIRRERYEKSRGRKHNWCVWSALKTAIPYKKYHYGPRDIAELMANAANVPAPSLL
jgi:hypothetical protein